MLEPLDEIKQELRQLTEETRRLAHTVWGVHNDNGLRKRVAALEQEVEKLKSLIGRYGGIIVGLEIAVGALVAVAELLK